MKFDLTKAIFYTQLEVWLWISFFFFPFLLVVTCPISCPSPSGHIPKDLSLTVWVMWISMTTRFTCYDFLVTTGTLPLIMGANTVTFCNNLCWSRWHCNVWNVGWSGGVTNSISVGENRWSWLQWSSYSGQKNWYRSTMFSKERISSGQSIPQEEERSQ